MESSRDDPQPTTAHVNKTPASALSSNVGQVVETGALGFVLAIGHPREQEQTTAHDHDRRSQPSPHPDRIEDQDPDDTEDEDCDRGGTELEGVAHSEGVYECGCRRRKRW